MVRAVEERLRRIPPATGGAPAAQCAPGPEPAGALDYAAHVTVMLDLMALAFQCDLTRVIGTDGSSPYGTKPLPELSA